MPALYRKQRVALPSLISSRRPTHAMPQFTSNPSPSVRRAAAAARLPRPLFDAIYEMNAAPTHADFISAVVHGLARLIRADVYVLQFFDRANQRLEVKMIPERPFLAPAIAYYMAHPQDMPLVAYYQRTGDTRARRMCDVTDMAAWRRSEYYKNCLQRFNAPYALALPVTVDAATVAGFSCNRGGHEFALGDCALLDAFAPHFRLAWSRQKNPWHTGPRPAGPGDRRPLTARESDVLYWMAEGKQNREIAIILAISLGTVQEHVANVVRKLGQENRHAATVFALRHLGHESAESASLSFSRS